jgi:hypothetical protein
MREKITHLIHDLDRDVALGDADVNMQTEDKIGPRHLLHVFHDSWRSVRLR